MPNLAVVDMEGKNVGTIELAESVFGIEPNAAVMHQMVVMWITGLGYISRAVTDTGCAPCLFSVSFTVRLPPGAINVL